MTPSSAASPEARAVVARCLEHLGSVARQVVAEVCALDPRLGELSPLARDVEMADTVRQALRSFAARVRGEARDHEYGRTIRERAAERAAAGVPLDALLRSYLTGARTVWAQLLAAAEPHEAAALGELGAVLLAGLEESVTAVAATYAEEEGAQRRDRRARERALVRGLFRGEFVDLAELDSGEPPLLLAARISTDDPCPLGTERQLRRRVERALGAACAAVVLEDGLLTGLVQGGSPAPLADGLGELVGGTAHVVLCGGGEPEADAATALEVLRIVERLGRPPGDYRLADVLLEYQVSRPGPAADELAALLRPLAGRPELRATLEVYLSLGGNRIGTARELGVHPNTVDHRLARVVAATGLEPASPQGAVLARAALMADRLAQ